MSLVLIGAGRRWPEPKGQRQEIANLLGGNVPPRSLPRKQLNKQTCRHVDLLRLHYATTCSTTSEPPHANTNQDGYTGENALCRSLHTLPRPHDAGYMFSRHHWRGRKRKNRFYIQGNEGQANTGSRRMGKCQSCEHYRIGIFLSWFHWYVRGTFPHVIES